MAKKILVPVDDVPAAESVLPLIGAIARTPGATVRLLHVLPVPGNVTSPEGRVIAYADQEMDRLEAAHATRLRSIAEMHLPGLPVECIVRFGDPAEEILDEVSAFGADLVVVGTKTRSSLARALLGSVAEKIMRKSPAMVVLVRSAPVSV
jgi:nucleotide-binding universal stress UspA family protein